MSGTNKPAFADRRDAGRKLAARLDRFRSVEPLVLALPRGGVPVAFEVARALGAPLDLIMVRKISAPGMEEFGIGAVVDGHDPQIVLDEKSVGLIDPPAGYVDAEVRRQLKEIERRRHAYLGKRPPPDVTGRVVIVVDDGIATGNTALAAIRALRGAGPARIILAVPAAAAASIDALATEADEVISLHAPEQLRSVGEHYADFAQTMDEEVIRLLGASAPPDALPSTPFEP